MAINPYERNPASTGNAKFRDPFLLYSDTDFPDNFYTCLELARYLAGKNSTYRQACERVAAYFVAPEIIVKQEDGDTNEQEALKTYLEETIDIKSNLKMAGTECLIYGNSFWRIYFPFKRILIHPRGGFYNLAAFKQGTVSYNYQRMTYSAPDPKHKGKGNAPIIEFEFKDYKDKNLSKIRLANIDPTRMQIVQNFMSTNKKYVWRIDEIFTSAVRTGNLHQINETPREILSAISKDQDFLFNDDAIFHFAVPMISGISYNGFGFPPIILNYHSIHQWHVYCSINEAVGYDYMLPFRLITPAPGTVGNGADVTTNYHIWSNSIKNAINGYRKDPRQFMAVPVSTAYQELSGTGKSLVTTDLMEFQRNEILNGMGFPVELFTLNLQSPQLPTGIKLFENNFLFLYKKYNDFIRWVGNSALSYCGKSTMRASIQKPNLAYSAEVQAIRMQLAASGDISRRTAFSDIGLSDIADESLARAREDVVIDKGRKQAQDEYERQQIMGSADTVLSQKMEEHQQNMQAAQAQMGGAAPAQGGGGGAASGPIDLSQIANIKDPSAMQEMAQKIAEQLVQLDTAQSNSTLKEIHSKNETLWALVKAAMGKVRSEIKSQAIQDVKGNG